MSRRINAIANKYFYSRTYMDFARRNLVTMNFGIFTGTFRLIKEVTNIRIKECALFAPNSSRVLLFSHIFKCKVDLLGLLNDFFGIKYGRGFDFPVLGNWNTFTFLNVVPRTWSKVNIVPRRLATLSLVIIYCHQLLNNGTVWNQLSQSNS